MPGFVHSLTEEETHYIAGVLGQLPGDKAYDGLYNAIMDAIEEGRGFGKIAAYSHAAYKAGEAAVKAYGERAVERARSNA